jgi:hypothetical protein
LGYSHTCLSYYEYPICNGIPSYKDGSCNNNGNCTKNDFCVCNYGYGGKYCDNVICYNKENGTNNICNNNGICIDINTCLCKNNWYGLECNITKCFNIYSNDTTVCSNNGNCTKPDTCICYKTSNELDCSNKNTVDINYILICVFSTIGSICIFIIFTFCFIFICFLVIGIIFLLIFFCIKIGVDIKKNKILDKNLSNSFSLNIIEKKNFKFKITEESFKCNRNDLKILDGFKLFFIIYIY